MKQAHWTSTSTQGCYPHRTTQTRSLILTNGMRPARELTRTSLLSPMNTATTKQACQMSAMSSKSLWNVLRCHATLNATPMAVHFHPQLRWRSGCDRTQSLWGWAPDPTRPWAGACPVPSSWPYGVCGDLMMMDDGMATNRSSNGAVLSMMDRWNAKYFVSCCAVPTARMNAGGVSTLVQTSQRTTGGQASCSGRLLIASSARPSKASDPQSEPRTSHGGRCR